MEVPGLEMLKPRSSYTLLAGPWPYVRGLESKKLHYSIKLESRALEIAPSFLCQNPVKRCFVTGGVNCSIFVLLLDILLFLKLESAECMRSSVVFYVLLSS